MIRYMRHKEIDHAAWDALLERCPGRLWYARSRVLDLANPGWEALIDEEHGAIMPLTWRSKWGIRYLYNPYGLQQLGVFAPEPGEHLTRAFLDSVPAHFRYADIWANGGSPVPMGTDWRCAPQNNQILLGDRTISDLRAAYSNNHRRNLRRSPRPTISGDITPEAFMDLFERTTGARFGGSPASSGPVLLSILSDAVESGNARLACIKLDGTPAAAACYIDWQGRSIFLKSANDERGVAIKAMFHLIDHWIELHAGTGHVLDFAGSNTPSVAQFYAGFGAVNSTYFRYRLNRLPWPFRYLKP